MQVSSMTRRKINTVGRNNFDKVAIKGRGWGCHSERAKNSASKAQEGSSAAMTVHVAKKLTL